MTQSEAFEANLASSGGDSCVIRSKLLVTANLTATPVVVLNVTPQFLGARQASVGAVFSNYRIKQIVVKFMAPVGQSGTTANPVTLGFVDDYSGEGDAPGNTLAIAELRCSSTCFSGVTTPQYFTYEPVDKRLWYKTYAGATGSEPRLTTPASLYGGVTGSTAVVQFEIDATLVYKGAVDIGST